MTTPDGRGDMAASRNSKSNELWLRTLSGVVIIAGIITGIYVGGWAWNIVTALLSLISLAEYFMKAMKCSLIAAVIVMTAVFPISKDEFIMPGISERAFIAANNTSSYEFVDGKTSQVKSSVNASRLGNSAVVDDEEISQRKHSVVANKVSPAVAAKYKTPLPFESQLFTSYPEEINSFTLSTSPLTA